jgi:hypothetical protein
LALANRSTARDIAASAGVPLLIEDASSGLGTGVKAFMRITIRKVSHDPDGCESASGKNLA